jgi:sugar diacid utilization regulator
VRTSEIVNSAAIELLQRLTESLEIPFTLTDRHGTVIASTAGRPPGQVDAYALAVAKRGTSLEVDEAHLQTPEHITMFSPATEHAGLLPPAPGIYVPVRMTDEIAAVLFARGEPEAIRTKATIAATAAGLTLEFARGASDSMRLTMGPDLALRAMLRGAHNEAKRATMLVKVAGWNLLVPRVVLVITPPAAERLPPATVEVVRELFNALVPDTPIGQLGPDELVAIPPLPASDAVPSIAAVAHEVQQTLSDQGLPVNIGIGDTHIDLPILTGLRRSYREAAFSAHWARQMNVPPGVHTLRSLGPVAFLAPGQRARQRFASDVLEPLRKFPEILETVRIFLDSNLSLEAAAKQSGQHRHTVRSHLQRARELSGLDPRVLTDALQLKMALLLASPVQSV